MPKKTVLILEDDKLILEMHFDLVRQRKSKSDAAQEVGFHFAQSISQAKEVMRSIDDLHLVICDFNLIGGDSLDFIKEIRAQNTTIYLIACSSDDQNRQLQMEAGCDVEVDSKHLAIPKSFELLGIK